MLPGQMLLWQLKSVQDSPMNLRLKFRQNRVSNSWDITDIEFVWWGGLQSHFHVKPNFRWIVVELTLSWGFDNIKVNQSCLFVTNSFIEYDLHSSDIKHD